MRWRKCVLFFRLQCCSKLFCITFRFSLYVRPCSAVQFGTFLQMCPGSQNVWFCPTGTFRWNVISSCGTLKMVFSKTCRFCPATSCLFSFPGRQRKTVHERVFFHWNEESAAGYSHICDKPFFFNGQFQVFLTSVYNTFQKFKFQFWKADYFCASQ